MDFSGLAQTCELAGCRSHLGDWAGEWDPAPSWTSD